MKPNSYPYKQKLLTMLLLMLCCGPLLAQEQDTTTITAPLSLQQEDSVDHRRKKPAKGTPEYYEYKVERYQRFWRALIPNQSRFQYAGNVGMFNLGLGWHYGGKERRFWETDFMFGILLKHNTKHNHMTFTLRQSYVPFRIPLVWNFSIEPLATGLMVNFITGEDFWVREPSKYPRKYYGFSTAIRAHVFVGQRIRWEIPQARRKYVKAISFCYEISACDLDIASYFTNSYLSLSDILSLSLGIKLDAF